MSEQDEDPNPTWSRLWRVWVFFGIIYQFVALAFGKPLTHVARRRVLGRAVGSTVVGSFFAWITYHWLYDDGGGVGWLDLAVAGVGAVIGWLGWLHRERSGTK